MSKPLRSDTVDKINQFLKSADGTPVKGDLKVKAEDPPADLPVPEGEGEEGDAELPEGDLPMGDLPPLGEGGEGGEELEDEVEVEEEATDSRLDKIEEAIETLTEGLESQKSLLEKLLDEESVEDEHKDEFEDFVDESDDEDQENVDDEEFGVDEEPPTTAKTDVRSATLRDKRKTRLSGKVVKKAETGVSKDVKKTIPEQWNVDKSTKNTVKVYDISPSKTTPPKKEETPRMLRAADLDMEGDETAKVWKILDTSGSHLYSIPQGARSNEEFFCNAFAEAFLLEAQAHGVEETLKKYNATQVVAQVVEAPVSAPDPVVVVAEPAPAVAPVTEDERKVIANNFQRKFVRAFRLALCAMNKNLVPSPLKYSLFEIMSGLEVPDPEKIIEAAFAQAAEAHFDEALAKTEDYLRMGDEAFVETESMVGKVETAPAVVVEASPADVARGAALQTRAAKNSLPFVTTESNSESSAEDLYNAMPKPRLAMFLKKNK